MEYTLSNFKHDENTIIGFLSYGFMRAYLCAIPVIGM